MLLKFSHNFNPYKKEGGGRIFQHGTSLPPTDLKVSGHSTLINDFICRYVASTSTPRQHQHSVPRGQVTKNWPRPMLLKFSVLMVTSPLRHLATAGASFMTNNEESVTIFLRLTFLWNVMTTLEVQEMVIVPVQTTLSYTVPNVADNTCGISDWIAVNFQKFCNIIIFIFTENTDQS